MQTTKLRVFVQSMVFQRALLVGIFSGAFAVALKYADVNMGMNILERNLPDLVVFNVFIVFVSLVAAFRTSNTLDRVTDAAGLMHKLSGAWYDVACTLCTFCRVSEATKDETLIFQETLVRLLSLLSATCFDELENTGTSAHGDRHGVFGFNDLNALTQARFRKSEFKAEHVYQILQQLLVDGISAKILTIAPPILSRAFQELQQGLLMFHEAKKLAGVRFPYPYKVLTNSILISEAIFVPPMMAYNCKGLISAGFFTVCGTTLLWYINLVADVMDNPFGRRLDVLQAATIQHHLNLQLESLIQDAGLPAPTLVQWPLPAEADQSMELAKGMAPSREGGKWQSIMEVIKDEKDVIRV